MTHRFKALLFDLDGTLIDSLEDLTYVTNKVLLELRSPTITREQMKHCVGDGLQTMLEKAFKAVGQPITAADLPARMAIFMREYASVTPQASCIYPGALKFLAQEKANGTKLALCTNKYEIATRSILAALGMDRCFDAVIGGDTLSERKPHPAQLLHALQLMGVEPADALMIGDSPNDALAARAAGIPCIILRHGYGGVWPEGLTPLYADDIEDCTRLLPIQPRHQRESVTVHAIMPRHD